MRVRSQLDVGLVLEMQIRPMRPSEPTVVYLANGDHMWRLDVNGGHHGRHFTHVQTRASSGSAETTVGVQLQTVDLPLGPQTVSGNVYRAVFFEAARMCSVQTEAVVWTDPSGGMP